MGQSMMKIKVRRKEKARKTESQGKEDARKTDAEAQGQENVYQEEGRIIIASADEDMLEDIVKEVILFELNQLLIDSFFKFQLAARKKAGASWRKMAADRESF